MAGSSNFQMEHSWTGSRASQACVISALYRVELLHVALEGRRVGVMDVAEEGEGIPSVAVAISEVVNAAARENLVKRDMTLHSGGRSEPPSAREEGPGHRGRSARVVVAEGCGCAMRALRAVAVPFASDAGASC